MSITFSHKPWKKYAAYPGQPSFLPRNRIQGSTWQDLMEIVHQAEEAEGPRELRVCGSHWAFSDVSVSPLDMVETNDPDERDNPAAPRFNKPLKELLPDRLSGPAAEYFEYQLGVDFDPNF